MSNVDRILDLLDNELQRSPEIAFPEGSLRPDICWRCQGTAGVGPSGVCDNCRAILLDDTYVRSEPPRFTFSAPRLLIDGQEVPGVRSYRVTMTVNVDLRPLVSSFAQMAESMCSFSATLAESGTSVEKLLETWREDARSRRRPPFKRNARKYGR